MKRSSLFLRSSGCRWSFRTLSKLRRHEKSHKNERRHVCGICSKAYLRSGKKVGSNAALGGATDTRLIACCVLHLPKIFYWWPIWVIYSFLYIFPIPCTWDLVLGRKPSLDALMLHLPQPIFPIISVSSALIVFWSFGCWVGSSLRGDR